MYYKGYGYLENDGINLMLNNLLLGENILDNRGIYNIKSLITLI